MEHKVKIKQIGHVTPDVLRIVTEKPMDYHFTSGQATDVSINNNEWRAFTFTCLPTDDYLEFTIKTYPSRQGVTYQLLKLEAGDELQLHDVFGDIAYKGEGLFIAGGAGVTPFVSIFRELQSKNTIGNNKLLFANKTKADIIYEEEFKQLLGNNFINILSDEQVDGYLYGFVSEELLKRHLGTSGYVYLCGPPPMMDAVEEQLHLLGVSEDRIIKEAF